MINQKECVVIIVNLQAILFRRQSWEASLKENVGENQQLQKVLQAKPKCKIRDRNWAPRSYIRIFYDSLEFNSMSIQKRYKTVTITPKTTTIPVIPLIKPGETFFYLSSSLMNISFVYFLFLFNTFTTISKLILWLSF